MESSGTVIPMSMDLHLSLWLLPSRLLVVQDRQTYCITLEMARRRSKRDLSLLSQLSVSSHSLRPSYYCLHLTSRISSHSHTWLLSSSGNRVYIPGHSWERRKGRQLPTALWLRYAYNMRRRSLWGYFCTWRLISLWLSALFFHFKKPTKKPNNTSNMNDLGAGLCFMGSHCKVLGISGLDQVFPKRQIKRLS